jgi:RIO kinase 1
LHSFEKKGGSYAQTKPFHRERPRLLDESRLGVFRSIQNHELFSYGPLRASRRIAPGIPTMSKESEENVWTYTPTKSERVYLTESLGEFFEDELLVDVLYKVRAGKEATCYCCRAHEQVGGGLLAAKVYRPGKFRTMRNDWYYRIGRTMSTGGRGVSYRGRAQRALKNHSRFGKQIETLSWSKNEFTLLSQLAERGADVPKPIASSDKTIVMEFFGDEVRGAPTLHMVSLDPAEAHSLFSRVMDNIETMLREFLVHADLSAHNILYSDGQIRIIDLPQAIEADKHPGAFELLSRDIDRVCQYFRKQGVTSNPMDLAIDLWQRMQEGRL